MRSVAPIVAALFAAGLIGAPVAVAQDEPQQSVTEQQEPEQRQDPQRPVEEEVEDRDVDLDADNTPADQRLAYADEPQERTLRGQFVDVLQFVKQTADDKPYDEARAEVDGEHYDPDVSDEADGDLSDEDRAALKARKEEIRKRMKAEKADTSGKMRAKSGQQILGFIEDETTVGEIVTPENAYIVVIESNDEKDAKSLKEEIMAHLNKTVEIRAKTFNREGLYVASVRSIDMMPEDDATPETLPAEENTPEERESL